MLTDVCVNLDNRQFQDDRSDILPRASAQGVTRLVLTGTDLTSSAANLEWTNESCVATAGIHPHDIGQAPPEWQDRLAQLAEHPDVRAIGETGLDFNRNYSPRDKQLAGFKAHIEIARTLNKPLFVHDRESDGAVYECLGAASHTGSLPPVLVHCFTGDFETLDNYIKAGYFIGITGWVADVRRGHTLRELVGRIPLDQLMVETDAPFLRPHNAPQNWHLDQGLTAQHKRRNEPALLPYVVSAIAEVRPESEAEIAAATYANAGRFFGFESSV